MTPIDFLEDCCLEGGIHKAIKSGYNENNLDGTDQELFMKVKRIVNMNKRLNILYDNLSEYAYQNYKISTEEL